ncbi:MAG: ecotin family protein [Burkholderiales bacterium]|jgi:ecotin
MTSRLAHFAAATCLTLATLLTGPLASASGKSPLDPFPTAGEGTQRFVIELPGKQRNEEDAFKVELVAGKMMLTDGVNLVRLGSSIQPRDLKGWGYTYYEVVGSDEAMSTLMAPPEGTPMVERFVTGMPLLVRYNSRLPIVIYAPDGYQVRYRIWQADETFNEANQR